ncbi:hypothetical protein ZWY2020_046167 [Hordeum vulgare]|nr:hypothetical protein ZWY2020_046167 [Hordeum vulgare]
MYLLLEKCMFGRQMEMELVMNFLLQAETAPGAADHLSVLPIIGPRKVGKSTLIEHVCNNERVRNHFSEILFFNGDDLKDASVDTNTIRDGGRIKHQNRGMGGGRTLIIIELLMDIEDPVWKRLYSAAKSCIMSGSKMIIVSRSDKVASFGTTEPLRLQFLTQEAYWYFFKVRSFGSTRAEDHPKFASMAMEMANMTSGCFMSGNIFSGILKAKFNPNFWSMALAAIRSLKQRNISVACRARSMAGGPIDFWNAWAVQILVLASLTLQVILLLLAGIRRRETSWRLFRFILWMAYQLADATAIYALGHLSFDGATRREHRLVAFWAPFLLLHLGGPDNITAYSLEDNRLWLRHLVTLGMQVAGAVYVLYKHYVGTQDMFVLAVILMFIVGVLKYGERTAALKGSNMDSIRSSLKKEPRAKCHFYLDERPPKGGFKGKMDEEEFLMRHAHSLFHICKHAAVDSSGSMGEDNREIKVLEHLTYEQRYVLMELELSLMYDILYTKAAVVHNLFGYCVCIVSPAAAASLLVFQFSGKAGHSRVDVLITYILLGSALLLEMRSLLSALGSSWTLPFLCGTRWSWLQHEVLCGGGWDRLRRRIVSLHRLIKVMGLSTWLRPSRRWSGTVGQYNMLHLCTRPSKRNSPLVGRFAKMLGSHSWTVKFPEELKQRLMLYIQELVSDGKVSTQGIIREKWGEEALDDCNLHDDVLKPLKRKLGVEFQEGVIIWHLATDLFLLGENRKKATEETMEEEAFYEESVRVMSNYMMFLLVERPYMLPGLSQSKLYRRTCENLVSIWSQEGQEHPAPSYGDLFRLYDGPNSRSRSSLQYRKKLAEIVQKENPDITDEVPRVRYAILVAQALVKNENDEKVKGTYSSLQVLFYVWRISWSTLLISAAGSPMPGSSAVEVSSRPSCGFLPSTSTNWSSITDN